MPLLFMGVPLAGPLTTVSATIACGFALAHYATRRTRDQAREREHQFAGQLDSFLAGDLRGRELVRAAGRLDSDIFWEAIMRLLSGPARRARRDLQPALTGSRHVRAERHALRDSDPARRELAARRLAQIGAARHRLALRHALVEGPELVSLAAATALARIRDHAALRWILEHPESLAHRPPQARSGLLRAFGRGAVPALEAALEHGIGEPRMERAVIDALAHAGRPAAAAAIAKRLSHEWRDVRVAAARALGVLGAAQCVGDLRVALGDPAWQVRAQAARAIGRLGAAAEIPALCLALRDPGWWVRRHAAYALAALGERGRAALLEAQASERDPYARDIAIEALRGGFPGIAS